jgi:hypothetical protein
MGKIGTGMEKIRIRDKYPGSATLVVIGSYLPSPLLKQTEPLPYQPLSESLSSLCVRYGDGGDLGASFNNSRTFSVVSLFKFWFYAFAFVLILRYDTVRYIDRIHSYR